MSNGQRCQVNYLEHITFAILAPLIVTLSYPTAGIVIAVGIFAGRLMFTIGYTMSGPAGRLIGALTMDLAIFVGFGYMVASALHLAPY